MSVHHWSIKLFAVSWALTAAFCFNTKALAVFIVNDTWQDGTRTDPAQPTYSENGTDSDSDGDLESAWYQGGDGTLDPVGAGGPLRAAFSSATSGSSASWTTYFTPEGSGVNLANPGDQLKVTWVFTPTNVNASNSSQNLRIALADSPAAARLDADGARALPHTPAMGCSLTSVRRRAEVRRSDWLKGPPAAAPSSPPVAPGPPWRTRLALAMARSAMPVVPSTRS